FFFQAEDGIRAFHVTGVQTCALPISTKALARPIRPTVSAGAAAEGMPALPRPVASVTFPEASFRCQTAAKPLVESNTAGPLDVEIGRASCRERVSSGGERAAWGDQRK